MRTHGKTLGSGRVSEDSLEVAERGAMLKGKDERMSGWVPATKLSYNANHLVQYFLEYLMGVESEGEAQAQTRQTVSHVKFNRQACSRRNESGT